MVQESDGGKGEVAGEGRSPWDSRLLMTAWLGIDCSESMEDGGKGRKAYLYGSGV